MGWGSRYVRESNMGEQVCQRERHGVGQQVHQGERHGMGAAGTSERATWGGGRYIRESDMGWEQQVCQRERHGVGAGMSGSDMG